MDARKALLAHVLSHPSQTLQCTTTLQWQPSETSITSLLGMTSS
jgi:hypothetical protein